MQASCLGNRFAGCGPAALARGRLHVMPRTARALHGVVLRVAAPDAPAAPEAPAAEAADQAPSTAAVLAEPPSRPKKAQGQDNRRNGNIKVVASSSSNRNNKPPLSKEQAEQRAQDRKLTEEKLKALIEGNPVGLEAPLTNEGLAACMRSLRPLTSAVERKGRTLLVFPSARPARAQQQKQRAAAAAPPAAEGAGSSAGDGSSSAAPEGTLELGLVAADKIDDSLEPAIILNATTKSNLALLGRRLAADLKATTCVAVRCAGPGAALVAVQAVAAAKRQMALEGQMNVGFSLRYLGLPPKEEKEAEGAAAAPAAEGAAAAASAAAPAAPAPAAETEQKQQGGSSTGSRSGSSSRRAWGGTAVLELRCYKTVLPTPKVQAEDFVQGRQVLLARMVAELLRDQKQVEVEFHSRQVVFVMRAVSEAYQLMWTEHRESIAAFLVDLQDVPRGSDAPAAGDAPDGPRGAALAPFRATLQVRRVPVLPQVVRVSSEPRGSPLRIEPSILPPPCGVVMRDTSLNSLAAATRKELSFIGHFSMLPLTGVSAMSTALRALWDLKERRAEWAAGGDTDPRAIDKGEPDEPGSEAAVADGGGSGFGGREVSEVALIPERQLVASQQSLRKRVREARQVGQQQQQQQPQQAEGVAGSEAGGVAAAEGAGAAAGAEREGAPRKETVVVLHCVDMTRAVREGGLRARAGTKMLMRDEAHVASLARTTALRNAMFGQACVAPVPKMANLMVLEPCLEPDGSLAVAISYIRTSKCPAEARDALQVAGRGDEQQPQPQQQPGGGDADGNAEGGNNSNSTGSGMRAPRWRRDAMMDGWEGLSAGPNTEPQALALAISAEASKEGAQVVRVRMRMQPRVQQAAAAVALAVALAQSKVRQRRPGVALQVVPTFTRKRDAQQRPNYTLIWNVLVVPSAPAGAGAGEQGDKAADGATAATAAAEEGGSAAAPSDKADRKASGAAAAAQREARATAAAVAAAEASGSGDAAGELAASQGARMQEVAAQAAAEVARTKLW